MEDLKKAAGFVGKANPHIMRFRVDRNGVSANR